MAMIRTKKQDNPFVQLDKHFIEDNSLTFKAKGILSYILSKPDGWQVRIKDLVNHTADGKGAVSSGLEELMLKGYVFKFQERGEGGQFGDWVYEVYERPEYNPKRLEGENIIKLRQIQREKKKEEKKSTETQKLDYGDSPKTNFPESEKPESEKPESENQSYSNNDSSNNDFNNINSNNNHHHEGFTKKQSALINEFLQANNLKIDDDSIISLVNKLKEYKPNSLEYIAKVYETIINDNGKASVQTKTNEIVPDWFKEQKKASKAKEQKNAPDLNDQEREELEKLLQEYK